jgi:hypothetical protein
MPDAAEVARAPSRPPPQPAEERFIAFLHLGAKDEGADPLGFLDRASHESGADPPAVIRKHSEAPSDPYPGLTFIQTNRAHDPVSLECDKVDCAEVPIILVGMLEESLLFAEDRLPYSKGLGQFVASSASDDCLMNHSSLLRSPTALSTRCSGHTQP